MRIDTIRLRATLGWLAILLPWIVAILNGGIPESISATYYVAQCVTPFMIILGSAAILLICYKGYEKIDDILLTCSGIFGLLVCLFPTYNQMYERVGTFQVPVNVSSMIHNISAIVFFGLLAYNSFFLFTKTNGDVTKNKKIRNIIYRVCGIGMIASFALMLLPSFPCIIWVVETVALFFFGISFLTKADIYPFLFCDSPYKD